MVLCHLCHLMSMVLLAMLNMILLTWGELASFRSAESNSSITINCEFNLTLCPVPIISKVIFHSTAKSD